MKKITDLVAKLSQVSTEQIDIEKLKIKAEADLKAASAPELDIAHARKLILDAHVTLDLCAAKLNRINPRYCEAANELMQVIKKAASIWNNSVSARKIAVEDRIVQNSLLQFNGDERAARRYWEQGEFIRLPIFHTYRVAFYPEEALRETPRWDVAKMARHFISHLEVHAESVGIKISDIEAAL